MADDIEKHKPDPAPLLECLKRLDIDASEAIYIGDSLSDYQAAKHVQMDFGYAKWGSVSGEGIVEPDYVFEEPKDLLELLQDTE
ncbi:HAD family hydrolase [Paraliobacillus sp. JSM ZJ581]|uniref:HAD family hydrolase n=1 Tax=Paraliobacillus sp. JSM ZJ581 TaxID=3342118 RepID=UPI0035A83E28